MGHANNVICYLTEKSQPPCKAVLCFRQGSKRVNYLFKVHRTTECWSYTYLVPGEVLAGRNACHIFRIRSLWLEYQPPLKSLAKILLTLKSADQTTSESTSQYLQSNLIIPLEATKPYIYPHITLCLGYF